jgi:serine/threonine-protein kinase RsbW
MRTTALGELLADTTREDTLMPGFEGPCQEAILHRADEVPPLVDDVVAALIDHGYSACDCNGFRLALEEAVVNALRHGNRSDPTKRVRVCYLVGPKAVLAEVEDEGPGFDPTTVPDPTAAENLDKPTGRGLHLMRHYTSWLFYNGRGNRLTMCKYRPAR